MNVDTARLYAIVRVMFGTQRRLAEDLGLHEAVVSYWLRGRRSPTPEQLSALAELGVNVDYLMGNSSDPFASNEAGKAQRLKLGNSMTAFEAEIQVRHELDRGSWEQSDIKRMLSAQSNATEGEALKALLHQLNNQVGQGEAIQELSKYAKAQQAGTAMKLQEQLDELKKKLQLGQPVASSPTRLSSEVGIITVDKDAGEDVIIPMLESSIPAGDRVPIYEDLATSFNVTQYYRNCFTMRVKGDSMIDAGINDGDRVIIKSGHRFRDGDVIAAVVDGELTLKGVWKRDGKIYLVPANSKYSVVELDEGTQFQCIGVCIDTFRPPKRVNWRP
jgi:SOS-response transcriptional repressor LexA/transcriptional regulator with XRE-family HTH domain